MAICILLPWNITIFKTLSIGVKHYLTIVLHLTKCVSYLYMKFQLIQVESRLPIWNKISNVAALSVSHEQLSYIMSTNQHYITLRNSFQFTLIMIIIWDVQVSRDLITSELMHKLLSMEMSTWCEWGDLTRSSPS